MNQKQVDEHFNAESAFWRDAYQREDVLGTVFNQRKMVALKYIEELFLPKSGVFSKLAAARGTWR